MRKTYNTPVCKTDMLKTQDIVTMSVLSLLSSFDDGTDISSLDWSE
ncbi:MAG: hypothetical protein IJ011_09145 [Clostridia bacterium]|nr:hypothetical protein [Clostridia bacterium]